MHQSSSTYRPSTTNATLSAAIPRFDFAGKVRDEETGLSYFGARYYDADLITGWLSVDPMADKYPGMSPYNYCAGNPVRLVDPDGRDWYIPQGATEPVWQKNITEKNLPPGATYIGKTVGWSGQHDYDMGYAFHGDELGNLTCMDWESMRTATINYKDNSMKKISHYSMTVLFENMLASGVEQVTITSTFRTPEGQAAAMLSNIEQGNMINYASAGRAVNKVYDISKSHAENLDAMIKEIYKQGPTNVSKHCSDGVFENVCDIVIPNNARLFYDNVCNDNRVSKYLCPFNDKGEKCHHIQIIQPK